jgi:hypothetical protein
MALGLPINEKHSASSSDEIVDLQTYTDLINSERPDYLAKVVFPGYPRERHQPRRRSSSPLHHFTCLTLCGRASAAELIFFYVKPLCQRPIKNERIRQKDQLAAVGT